MMASCAPSRFVKPLDDGEQAVNASMGGAIINVFGMSIPIPYSSLTYARGFKNDITAYGGLHTTALAYGVVQVELGLTKGILKPDTTNWMIPGISSSLTLYSLYGKWYGNVRFWPQLDVNAYWQSQKNNNIFYLGLNNWFELSTTRVHDEVQENHWIFSPQFGYTIVGKKWDFNVEIKYLAPMFSNEDLTVKFFNPHGGKGAIGFYFGVSKRF